ncbi:MAG: 2-keto-4-pentenoate hydratase [Burkholderiales bacterium]|jgi:2-keto-4-pentenoate hydratase
MFNPSLAADPLCTALRAGHHLTELPVAVRPQDRAQGYAVQREWITRLGPAAGWKIAATSLAGQQHIAVSGPLAGPVFADRVQDAGASVSLQANRMRVAECEIVFRFGQDLPARSGGYTPQEVRAAVDALAPGIEVPDSRFMNFEKAGEAQLIADCACCRDMVLGHFMPVDERMGTLAGLRVRATVNDGRELEGIGSNVLGDPLAALLWFVNELSSVGQTLSRGQFVTTGACVTPIPVLPGQKVEADFGWLGRLGVSFV